MADVKPVPDNFASVSVYLIVDDARAALSFYEKAFDGTRGDVMEGPDGSIMHAEVRIGDSTVMLSSANPQWEAHPPKHYGGSPCSMHVYVDDADAAFTRALEAGCEVKHPVMDMFWGDRYGKLVDPFGHTWGIATRKEILTADELAERQKAFFAEMAKQQASDG